MRREHEKTYIYGKHALTEALLNAPHIVKKVFLSPEMDDRELRDLLKKKAIPAVFMRGSKEAEKMVGRETSHQGVIAIADTQSLVIDFRDFIEKLEPTKNTLLVILDELNDPHNVGAIIRSATAFGASGVLIPPHNQAPITGTVVKTSAGMVFRVPIVAIGNVNYAITALKEKGFKAYALLMDGQKNVAKEIFDAPTILVIGNEAKGVREKTIELCDVKLRIPMDTRCESLNASVSAAVVAYEWYSQHQKTPRHK
ncbi:MAG: 23S rRNA (guanosine(2251)-2'-O)-methyltransferase RlmB [Candidatus Wolfebacteria bacterium]|nr:23S rRNA (guanosine(2251)-2'-O)-methyltransferase RlmB [Candidatus Wolfebacteria bacterium]